MPAPDSSIALMHGGRPSRGPRATVWTRRAWARRACALLLAGSALTAAAGANAGELGAFLAHGAVGAYERGPREGGRLTLRPGTAYTVVGVVWDKGDVPWLRLSVPEHVQQVRGEGWTPLTAQELSTRNAGLVEIFSRPVEPGQTGVTSVQVAASEVHILGRAGEASQAFPQVAWRNVRYTLRRPAQPWVAAAQGTYRPGRSAAFLRTAVQEMTAAHVPAETFRRLLAGIVRPGDAAQEIRWAWGEPLRTWNEGAEGHRVAVWEYAEGELRFEGARVKEVR